MGRQVSRLLTISLAALLVLSWTGQAAFATQGVAPPGTIPAPDPPLNPAALFAIGGLYSYASAGTSLRNVGSGTISVSYAGTVAKAYMIWSIINPTNDPADALASAMINGHAVTGVFQSDDASPCWGNGNLWVFAADVTPYVTSGANTVSGFASGTHDGSDPQSEVVAPLDEGASLVVISTGAVSNQIYIYTGAFTEPASGNPLSSTFNHGAADFTTATTTFIVADGQEPSNYAVWNGVTIDTNAFPGGDPTSGTYTHPPSYYDTRTYSVPVALGSTSQTAEIGANGGDCITWTGQVIGIPSTVPIVGAPQFGGSSLMAAAIGMAFVLVLAKRKQTLQVPV
jgi:hypothetical protein